MIIVIDYDGTIIDSNDAWPAPGTIRPGAKEVINELYENGHDIIIWTCRKGIALDNAKVYLQEQGLLFHYCNEHTKQVMEFYGDDTRKILADVYIDDKQLGGLPDTWEQIHEILKTKHLI